MFPVPLGYLASKMLKLNHQEKDSKSPACPLKAPCCWAVPWVALLRLTSQLVGALKTARGYPQWVMLVDLLLQRPALGPTWGKCKERCNFPNEKVGGAATEKVVSSLSLELFKKRLDDLTCLDTDIGFVESSL